MTQYEMTEKLSEKCNVTREEARNALESGDWNMLTAAQRIELEKVRRTQELEAVVSGSEAVAVQIAAEGDAPEEDAAGEDTVVDTAETTETAEKPEPARVKKHRGDRGFRNVGAHARRLVACGNRNRLVVRHGGDVLVELPVTVLVVLMLCAFWVCVPLTVIGLFAGCRYSFDGKDLGRDEINGALGKAADAAERIKKSVAEA